MQIGIVGLGRMGAGMARRLAQAGVNVLCYDQADEARAALQGTPHVECAENLATLCGRLDGERVIILMLPAGAAVEDTIRIVGESSLPEQAKAMLGEVFRTGRSIPRPNGNSQEK